MGYRVRQMKLNFRELLGLTTIFIGLVLIPAAWAFSRSLTVIAFILIFIGALLFFTDRMQKRADRMAEGPSAPSLTGGRDMPADIHNHTGWRTGGRRSDSFDGSDDSGGGDGD
jgi:uncharacterized membrane protein